MHTCIIFACSQANESIFAWYVLMHLPFLCLTQVLEVHVCTSVPDATCKGTPADHVNTQYLIQGHVTEVLFVAACDRLPIIQNKGEPQIRSCLPFVHCTLHMCSFKRNTMLWPFHTLGQNTCTSRNSKTRIKYVHRHGQLA